MQRVFLIEFNELSPVLLDEFMGSGLLHNFKRLYDSSDVFVTDAEENPPYLVPWIQWPTVHSGLSYREHNVFHLGDGAKIPEKCVGELLSDIGIPVGIFGSMNCNYENLRGYVLPDPWDKRGRANPVWLQPFYETVSGAVKESSRHAITTRDAFRLGAFTLTHGITGETLKMILNQLTDERKDSGLKWRRAAVLDSIEYDVFRYCNKRFDVRFASFYSNSTAHYQHFYWRNMSPELFGEAPAKIDHPSLKTAIFHGYASMDRLLGRFFSDYPGAIFVMATALSQEAFTGQAGLAFRPHDFGRFLRFAGIERGVPKPVMATQFHVEFADRESADEGQRLFEALTIEGNPIMSLSRTNSLSIFASFKLFDEDMLEATIQSSSGARCRFGDLVSFLGGIRSGHHHRDGALWIRTGRHRKHDRKASIRDIAPTVLNLFGAPIPDYMRGSVLAVGDTHADAVLAGA